MLPVTKAFLCTGEDVGKGIEVKTFRVPYSKKSSCQLTQTGPIIAHLWLGSSWLSSNLISNAARWAAGYLLVLKEPQRLVDFPASRVGGLLYQAFVHLEGNLDCRYTWDRMGYMYMW